MHRIPISLSKGHSLERVTRAKEHGSANGEVTVTDTDTDTDTGYTRFVHCLIALCLLSGQSGAVTDFLGPHPLYILHFVLAGGLTYLCKGTTVDDARGETKPPLHLLNIHIIFTKIYVQSYMCPCVGVNKKN